MARHQHTSPQIDPPRHDELSWLTQAWELSCLLVASGLLVGLGIRVAPFLVRQPWCWLLIGVGAIAADFVSGIVHWTADTWGSETMPILGRRFVRPFRVHHVNQHDFLRRGFIDCNGDVAMLTIPFLMAGCLMSVDRTWGIAAATFCFGFCCVGLPTNQVHQWAHMRRPPRIVRWLQRNRLILGRADHQRHHRPPHVVNYCIATGWCNPALAALHFFPRLERMVTRCTGFRPRDDDGAFAELFQGEPAPDASLPARHDEHRHHD